MPEPRLCPNCQEQMHFTGSNAYGRYRCSNASCLTTNELSAPSAQIDAATFGRAIAKAVKKNPYSSNWALVAMAVEIATGEEISDMEEIPELINRLAEEERV